MASEKDIQDIIQTLIAEGVGEGKEGMRRIAETILNRAEQRGISPAEVVRQHAQYTGYSSPGPAAVRAFSDPSALTAAQAAWQQAQGPDDPTGGANHYWNPNVVSPSWAGGMTQLGQYGNHAFATDRPVVSSPRVPPMPVALSPTGAAIRQMTSPSGGNGDLQTALDRVATRERNRVTPAPVEDRVTARNRAVWQAPADPFNGDPMTPANGPVVASIPTLPKAPTTRPVATTIIRPSASDLVPGNPMQTMERATTIASIPTTKFPTTEQIVAGTGFRLPPEIPDRLVAGLLPPANYGDGVAGVGTRGVAPVPFPRPAFPTQFAAAPKVAPVPFQRPTAVGSALAVRPMPPMPPMPIARPGIGGPFRQAPVPMPANMRPPAPRAPLQVIVNGGNSQPRTLQGYTDAGNGKLVSDETGGVYYSRHLK